MLQLEVEPKKNKKTKMVDISDRLDARDSNII